MGSTSPAELGQRAEYRKRSFGVLDREEDNEKRIDDDKGGHIEIDDENSRMKMLMVKNLRTRAEYIVYKVVKKKKKMNKNTQKPR